MSTAIVKANNEDIIHSLVINGDLSKMDANMKVVYYKQYCERLGLDPFTQPFKILRLNGKETLYCDRSGAQQLNKIHKISHMIQTREVTNGCYVVTAKAYDSDGRQEESIGAVSIDGLKGEALCNAMMKAETKAKRRSTLDLLGLGVLDESEVDAIPGAITEPAPTVSTSTGQAVKALPIISAAQFKKAKERIAAKESGVYDKIISSFSLTDSQRAELDEILQSLQTA
jgi:hypothetical protein